MDAVRRSLPVLEFLKDRIYLGAYDSPPDDTPQMVHFTIDDSLPYNAFHHDFGPLNFGHLYRFAIILHSILGEEVNEGRAVCLYSRPNPRDRANAACLLCCYMILVQSWPPHLVLTPIAQADPPFMPFRDAGYAPADFILSIQDVVYGLWKAKEKKFLDIHSIDLEEYELYERVDHGDFNEIAPHFIAFASPQQGEYETQLNYPFQQVLKYFTTHNVQLVVRLNSHLYDNMEFEQRGIKHIDLIFEDGSCPTMEYVQAFIGAVEGVIAQNGKVAVHCKAGLGRTGCLIGAHLIYAYGFTANEAIAYMRFIRPGMVVGPQQHWLYLHQNEFRDWRRTMTVSQTASEKLAGFCPLVPRTSPETARSPSAYIRSANGASPTPRTPERSILGEVGEANTNSALPVPTPGQPRKNSPSPAHNKNNTHSYYRQAAAAAATRAARSNSHQEAAAAAAAAASEEQYSDEDQQQYSREGSSAATYDPEAIYQDQEDDGYAQSTETFTSTSNEEDGDNDIEIQGVTRSREAPGRLHVLKSRARSNAVSSAAVEESAGSPAPVTASRRQVRAASRQESGLKPHSRITSVNESPRRISGTTGSPESRRRNNARNLSTASSTIQEYKKKAAAVAQYGSPLGAANDDDDVFADNDQENRIVVISGSSKYTNSDDEEDDIENVGVYGASPNKAARQHSPSATSSPSRRLVSSILPGKRNVTETGLSTKQQLILMRQQMRAASNPNVPVQLMTTTTTMTTTTKTTTTTKVASPTGGSPAAGGAFADISELKNKGEGMAARRTQRVSSGNGVRKTSGGGGAVGGAGVGRHKR